MTCGLSSWIKASSNLTDLIAMRPSHMVISEVRADDNFMNIGALDSNEICMRYKKNQAHPMNLLPFRMMKMQSRKDWIHMVFDKSCIIPRLNLHHIQREQVRWTSLDPSLSRHIYFTSRGSEFAKLSSVCHLPILWFQCHQFIIFVESGPKTQGVSGKISPIYVR